MWCGGVITATRILLHMVTKDVAKDEGTEGVGWPMGDHLGWIYASLVFVEPFTSSLLQLMAGHNQEWIHNIHIDANNSIGVKVFLSWSVSASNQEHLNSPASQLSLVKQNGGMVCNDQLLLVFFKKKKHQTIRRLIHFSCIWIKNLNNQLLQSTSLFWKSKENYRYHQ